MLHLFYNDHLFNKYTHILFPARSYWRELIYWPAEFGAAILMFIWILQVDVFPNQLYLSRDDSIVGWQPKPLNGDGNIAMSIRSYDDNGTKKEVGFGILGIAFTKGAEITYQIGQFDTDLLNREYAWMCLCWFIKHFFYFLEAIYLLVKKQNYKNANILPQDLATHVLNATLWGFWTVYGWIKEGDQIHAGMYERIAKDKLMDNNYAYTDATKDIVQKRIDDRNAMITRYENWYSDIAGWNWLWIICIIIFTFNLVLWIVGLIQKRSSAYTGQAISTIFIPAQLFFLHLHIKGSWAKSNVIILNTLKFSTNGMTSQNTIKSYYNALEYAKSDYFEARWVFWIIYLSAYVGLVFAVVCILKACQDYAFCKVSGTRYICYAIFWVSSFIWILCMDNTLYHYFYQYGPALVTTHIISLAAAFVIACLSIFEKKRECVNFFERHNNWAKWDDPAFNYPRACYNCPANCATGQPFAPATVTTAPKTH